MIQKEMQELILNLMACKYDNSEESWRAHEALGNNTPNFDDVGEKLRDTILDAICWSGELVRKKTNGDYSVGTGGFIIEVKKAGLFIKNDIQILVNGVLVEFNDAGNHYQKNLAKSAKKTIHSAIAGKFDEQQKILRQTQTASIGK
jgi:hypothetical protein